MHFTNKEDYLNQRKALLDEANRLNNENKVEEAEIKAAAIEDLDNKWEEDALAIANKNALSARLNSLNLSNIGNRSNPIEGIEGGNMDPINNVLNDETIYVNAFAKTLMGQALNADEKKVFDTVQAKFLDSTQTTSSHTVVVPETVVQNIWKEMGEQHPIIADVDKTFIPGDVTLIKDSSTDGDGQWYDEDTTVTDDTISEAEVNLKGYELAKAITISWKLKKMSIQAFLAHITTKIAEKMGNAVAKGIVEGKGLPGQSDAFKAQPKGIAVELEGESNTPQIITYSTSDPLTYDKLTSMMSKQKSGYKAGSKFYAKSDFIWNELATLKDTVGRPLFVPDVTSGGVGKMFGCVVSEEDAVSDNELLFGNVKKGYVMNVNEDMTIYQEDHVKARTTDYMGYAIIDGAPITTKAFSLLKKQ